MVSSQSASLTDPPTRVLTITGAGGAGIGAAPLAERAAAPTKLRELHHHRPHGRDHVAWRHADRPQRRR